MSAHSLQPAPSRAGLWPRVQYGLVLIALAAVVAGGYLAFRRFVQTPDWSTYNLYALAVVAGVASFFSPCAFPLLPGYLSFYYLAGSDESGQRPGAGRALRLGLAAALGVVTFNLILGIAIALLGAGVATVLCVSCPQPNVVVRLFRAGLGGVLLTLGVAQLMGWNLKPALADALAFVTRPRDGGTRGPAATLYLYGLGYNAAGMGCTGPILAGLVVVALTSGGFASALSAFGIFSLTMGGLMLLVSGLAATSQTTLITHLKASASKIKQASSILLMLVGVFHIYAAINIGLFVRLLFP